jgi:alpha-L-fucosidase
MVQLPEHWRWFPEARFGLFVHWGPYSAYGRGEQALFREHLDQQEYGENACRWNPGRCDPARWAEVAKGAGMRYAVLTTRHHDGYCLWDSRVTDYTSAAQAPRRDFVREYVEAFRAAGLRIGLYYSLADWRVPAYWEGAAHDPSGWEGFRDYVHTQVEELLTGYGPIDLFWFDGAWPHSPREWRSRELVERIRALQPHLLINNRLGRPPTRTSRPRTPPPARPPMPGRPSAAPGRWATSVRRNTRSSPSRAGCGSRARSAPGGSGATPSASGGAPPTCCSTC